MSITIGSLYSLVTERIRDGENDPVTIEDVRVLPTDTQDVFRASAVVMEEIDESVSDPSGSDELQDYLDARTESWMVEVEFDNPEVAAWVDATVSEFTDSVSLSSQVEITSVPELRFVSSDDLRLLMDITITPQEVTDSIDTLRTVLNKTSGMIPSENSLRTMTVRLTDFNYDEQDWSTPHHDFTIYFATDTPHEYWANCETLEDYFEMCAENNEDTTIQEIREQDEYYSHTHLMNGKGNIIEWLETFTTDVVAEHTSVTDQITVFPYRLKVDFETEDVTLKCDIREEIK